MTQSIGNRIAQLRRSKGLTQEEVAEHLGVSAQAVSKWENDISYPDITLIPKLAELLSVSTDVLLKGETQPETRYVAEAERKPVDDMILKITVNTQEGDKVRLRVPIPLVKVGLEIGMQMPEVNGQPALKDIDLDKLLLLIEKGAVGKLVEVESADGDFVEIYVE